MVVLDAREVVDEAAMVEAEERVGVSVGEADAGAGAVGGVVTGVPVRECRRGGMMDWECVVGVRMRRRRGLGMGVGLEVDVDVDVVGGIFGR